MAGFEWILCFKELREFLDPKFLKVQGGRALVVGCGRSALSRALLDEGFFTDIISVDCEPAVIEAMQSLEPSLDWVCADCCDAEAMAGVMRAAGRAESEARFDVVIDKGTMDAILCDDGKVASLLCECYKALKPGGVYVCVSLRGRGLLDRLFASESPCDWSYEAFSVDGLVVGSDDVGRELRDSADQIADSAPLDAAYTVALLRRPADSASGAASSPPSLAAMQAHCAASIDGFFTGESPLLTGPRELALREAFEERLEDVGTASLPLAEAYALLFTAEERDEYTADDFFEDAAASEHARADPARMTIQEALAFLKENQ